MISVIFGSDPENWQSLLWVFGWFFVGVAVLVLVFWVLFDTTAQTEPKELRENDSSCGSAAARVQEGNRD